MRLFIMFGQRTQRYEGEFAPEALFCWDEYCVEENPEGFAQECDEARKRDGFSAFRVIAIEVDANKISQLLNKMPVVVGTIASDVAEADLSER